MDKHYRYPSVSIIVPNYSHAKYIKKALTALLAQTITPLELIVVDDGSVDDSLKVIKEFVDSNLIVRLIEFNTNKGVNTAINKGLSEAKGDYVFFSAADDVVERTFLEQSLDILKKYPNAGFSFCEPAEIDEKTGEKYVNKLYLSNKPVFISPRKFVEIMKHNYFTFPSNTVVFKRDLLLKVKGFLENLECAADWFACFSLMARYGACYVPEPLAWFYVREESYSGKGLKDSINQCNTLFKVFDLLDKSENKDLCDYFKKVGIIYEISWRVIFWLLVRPSYWKFLSFLTIKRMIIRGAWNWLKFCLPLKLRRKIRMLSAKFISEKF